MVDSTLRGKRGYLPTSVFDVEDRRAGLFRRPSDRFEVCAVGLGKVRREWEELRKDPPPAA